MLQKLYHFILSLTLILHLSGVGYCAVQITAIDTTGEERCYLGTVTGWLRDYAVMREVRNQKDFLYKEGDIVNNKYEVSNIYGDYLILKPLTGDKRRVLLPGEVFGGFKFLNTAQIYKFEYWYRLKDRDAGTADKRFELAEIRCFKAVLIRDCKRADLEFQQDKPTMISEGHDSRQAPGELRGIDETFFEQLKTKYMGNDVWVVAGKSVTTPVLEKAAREAIELVKNVRAIGFGSKDGPKLRFTSKIASGVLSRDGFLAGSLGPELMRKSGLFPGDVIESVNGRKVTSMLGMVLLFLEIKKDNISQVTVNIVRNNKPKQLTYLIQ